MGEDNGERMEEVEDAQPEDIWGDDPDPGEPSPLRALHGGGEPFRGSDQLGRGESRCFPTANAVSTAHNTSSTLRPSTSRSTSSTFDNLIRA